MSGRCPPYPKTDKCARALQPYPEAARKILAALLAVVPDIDRDLPVVPDLFPQHGIFRDDLLRRRAFGLEADGPDLARSGWPERFHVERRQFRIGHLLGKTLPQRADRLPALHHRGAGRKHGCVLGIPTSTASSTAFRRS